MANNNVVLSTLDFNTNKQNFKNFLASQAAFKDYNFEGSNMSILLDLLSYNTYLNAFILIWLHLRCLWTLLRSTTL